MENTGDIGRRLRLTKYEIERIKLAEQVGAAAVQMETALSAYDQALMTLCQAVHALAYNPIAEKLAIDEGEAIKVDLDTEVAVVVKQEEIENEHPGT